MSVSYSNTYNFLIYRRNTNAKTAGTPNPNKINMLGNWLVFDQYTGNVWADSYESATVNHAYLLSGHGFVNSNNLSSSDSFTFAGDTVFAESFNGNTAPEGAYNIPLGGFSSAFGLGTYTRHVGEMSIGVGNINGYTFSSGPRNGVVSPMLFSVGNSNYVDTGTDIKYSETAQDSDGNTSHRSNIFSVTKDYTVTSGASYIGYTFINNSPNPYNSYVLSNANTSSALYVNNTTYTTYAYMKSAYIVDSLAARSLDTEDITLSDLYFQNAPLPLGTTSNHVPTQLYRTTGLTSSGSKYYYNVSYTDFSIYVNELNNNYIINWIDYYETTFRDSICCFKKFVTNPSGDEYSLFNTSELSSLINELKNSYAVIPQKRGSETDGFIIDNCYPIYSRTSTWGSEKFHIYISWSGVGNTVQGGEIYLRPCKEVYYVLAALAGDVDQWFNNHAETINNISFNCRWSPVTQYQDTDTDTSTFNRSTRVNNQIYFCIADGNYYIKYYTGRLQQINLFSSGSSGSTTSGTASTDGVTLKSSLDT